MMNKSFASEYPELVKEWDYELNGGLLPTEIPPKGRKKVWWKCPQGHNYFARLADKANGRTCPKCRQLKSSLAVVFPERLKWWDYDKNDCSPYEISYGSNIKCWWICPKNHSFKTSVGLITRSKNKGCPYCRGIKVNKSNSLATLFPRIAKEWVKCIDNPKITPHDVPVGTHKKVKWQCEYGHTWITAVKSRAVGKTNCPICSKHIKISKPAYTIYYYLSKIIDEVYLEYQIKSTRYKLDIFIPQKQIAIEYDGGFYHQDPKKEIAKDQLLLEKMKELTLIHIREPDCCAYISPNKNVKKYFLKDQSEQALEKCIEDILQRYFNVNTQINIDDDDLKILKGLRTFKVKQSLAKKYPELIKEWDYEKNLGISPYFLKAASHEKVYWKCKKGHSWLAVIASRSHGKNNCPICGSRKLGDKNNLAYKFPKILKEWDYKKNKKPPHKYFPSSHFKVWWICSKCNYEWQTRITSRTSSKTKCPNCRFGILDD